MKTVWLATIAALAASAALAGDAGETVKARQQGMKAIGAATKGLSDGLNSDASATELKGYADRLAQLAGQSAAWFPAGSGPQAGLKTKVLPAVWTRPTEFAAARAAFAAQATRLQAVAAGGDRAAIRAQFGALRKTCKTCHDDFKARD